ncbi:cobalt transport protein [Ignisphaera aggregans DSM 17230]|uniref:Cobalt transport protein n=1 Tax=Ignisphaera aggregans (strain DSM 17230 / JCM 13409 / AQ1.S1) TaxID=583356 RepID=E0SRY4_IGNAA|nr:cobalt transport protein [Ignisphaera aggregans DSM 17230]
MRLLVDSLQEYFISVEGRKLLYRLHPLTKIFLAIISIPMAIILDIYGLAIYSIYITILCIIGLEHRRFLRMLFSPAIFIGIISIFIFIYGLSSRGISINSIIALLRSIAIGSLRIYILVISFGILFSTTRLQSIARIFSYIGIPYIYIYMILLSLRFIPILLSDFIEIYYIQSLRGFDSGRSFLDRIRSLLSLFIPLFIVTLSRLDEVSLSLYLRGFGYSHRRSYTYVERLGYIDILVVISISILIGVLVWV